MFRRKVETIANVRVGRRDVRPDLPSHVAGVREGNRAPLRARKDLREREGAGAGGEATKRRSTGIEAKRRLPILPGMPYLSPP